MENVLLSDAIVFYGYLISIYNYLTNIKSFKISDWINKKKRCPRYFDFKYAEALINGKIFCPKINEWPNSAKIIQKTNSTELLYEIDKELKS